MAHARSVCQILLKNALKTHRTLPFVYCTIPNFRYHTPFLIHSTLELLSMNKFKIALLTAAFVGLFACTTTQQPKKTVKTRYLKNNISQAELKQSERLQAFITILAVIQKLVQILI